MVVTLCCRRISDGSVTKCYVEQIVRPHQSGCPSRALSRLLPTSPLTYQREGSAKSYLERETGVEPATLCLGSRCSTTELLPQKLRSPILSLRLSTTNVNISHHPVSVKARFSQGATIAESILLQWSEKLPLVNSPATSTFGTQGNTCLLKPT